MTHLAAAAPSARVLRLLLKGQVHLNVLDANGKHPIHWAARYQRLDNVRLLVEEAGIDPDLKTRRLGLSPLMEAAGSAKSGRSNPEAVAVIQYLLGTGRVDVNATYGSSMATALHFAATDGLLDVLEVLVAAGADLLAKRKDGKTAAQLAKASGHTEAARYLVEQSVQRGRAGPSRAAPASRGPPPAAPGASRPNLPSLIQPETRAAPSLTAAPAPAGPSSPPRDRAAAAATSKPALSSSAVLSGRRCHACNKRQDEPRVSLGACAGCLCTFYCSAACQQVDWGRGHEAACLGRLRRFLEAARASGLEVAEDHPVAQRGRQQEG